MAKHQNKAGSVGQLKYQPQCFQLKQYQACAEVSWQADVNMHVLSFCHCDQNTAPFLFSFFFFSYFQPSALCFGSGGNPVCGFGIRHLSAVITTEPQCFYHVLNNILYWMGKMHQLLHALSLQFSFRFFFSVFCTPSKKVYTQVEACGPHVAQIQTQSGPFSSHSRNTERCPVAKIIIAKESCSRTDHGSLSGTCLT